MTQRALPTFAGRKAEAAEGLVRQFLHPGGKVRLLMLAFTALAVTVVIVKGVLPAVDGPAGDFANFYTASTLFRQGESLERAYLDYAWFQKQLDRLGFAGQVGGLTPYPLPAVLLALPITALQPSWAQLSWVVLNLVLAALNAWLLSRVFRVALLTTTCIVLGCGVALLNQFLAGHLFLVQLSILLLSMSCLVRNLEVPAGIFLGILATMSYVGVLFSFLLIWTKKYRIFATAVAVFTLLLILFWSRDAAAMETYLFQVLPSAFLGETQDPFAVARQSWQSLIRRIFLFEKSLNPNPIVSGPLFFVLFKNLGLWFLVSVGFQSAVRLSSQPQRRELTEVFPVLIPCALLLSPGSPSSHLIFLAVPAVFSLSSFRERGRADMVLLIITTFLSLGLPHTHYLAPLAQGWWTPMAYPRLWLLLLFFLLVLDYAGVPFRHWINLRTASTVLIALALTVVSTFELLVMLRDNRGPGYALQIASERYTEHLGLIVSDPDIADGRVVFSYCEIRDDRYRVFTGDGEVWDESWSSNQFSPSLNPSAQELLFESVQQGKYQIWLDDQFSDPRLLVEGRSPRWNYHQPEFVFEREGDLFLFDLTQQSTRRIRAGGDAYLPNFAPDGGALAFASDNGLKHSLRILDLGRGEETEVFASSGRIEGFDFLDDRNRIVLASEEDLWLVDSTRSLVRRLTFTSSIERYPVWDVVSQRILFLSDRNRGLGCTAPFWFPFGQDEKLGKEE